MESTSLDAASYRQVVDALNDAVYIVDTEGRIQFCNATFERLTGYAGAALLGRASLDLYAPADRPVFLARRQQALRGEPVAPFVEATLYRADGTQLPVELSMTNYLQGEAIAGRIAVVRDIQQRKRIETQLRASERQYRSLFEHSLDAILLTAPDGTVLAANPAACQMFGCSAEELCRLGRDGLTDPHDPHLSAALAERARTGRFRGTLSQRRPDGTRFAAEMSSAIFTNEAGQARTWIILRDLSERQQAEAALHEHKERLQAILDHTTTVIYLMDPESRLLLINRRFEQLFHVTNDQVAGQPLEAVFPPEIAATFRAHNRQVFKAGEPLEFEEHVPQEDGLHIYLSIKVPLYDAQGQLYALCGISTDITERKRTEAELRRANDELGQFAAIVSHDLRNPLQMVALNAHLLAEHDSAQLDSDGRSMLEEILEGTSRMSAMLHDLLTYCSVGAPSEVAPVPVDCNGILAQVIEYLRSTIIDSGAVITQDPLPTVLAHQTPLVQLFQNLLSNAIKYRRDIPLHVHVSAQRTAEGWQFAVQDNGIGIAPQEAQRIFRLFTRLPGQTSEGTGIGLAICQKVVERYGGRIWVESTLNQGATFYFTFHA
jgi:PAS domain S-box-containing protein